MKIKKNYADKTFLDNLICGDLFEFEGTVYIITNERYNKASRLVVSLETGEIRQLLWSMLVTPLKGELTVEHREYKGGK